MITFANIWFLLLLLPVGVTAWIMLCRHRPAVKISSTIPLRKAAGKKRFLTAAELCLLTALILLAVAAARPRISAGSRKIDRPGVDMILAIDISGSMAAYDRPRDMSENEFIRQLRQDKIPNRLEAAKAEIRRFIAQRPNDRIGLIGFADLAYSFVPPTLDHQLLLERLETLSPGQLGRATGIASPVSSAALRLKDAPSPRPVIVLFTDGENTADNALTPQEAAKAAGELGVILHTVGIGSNQSYGFDFFGDVARGDNSLDEELLRELAKITGGRYYHAATGSDLAQIMDEINALEKTDSTSPVIELHRELAPYFAVAAIVILLLGSIISASGKVRLP